LEYNKLSNPSFIKKGKRGGDILEEVRGRQKEVDDRLQITIAKSKRILS